MHLKQSPMQMLLGFRWIKSAGGALDPEFSGALARAFGLRTFIETGTFLGDTIAAQVDRFDRLVSIELKPDLVEKARARFMPHPKVSIIQGHSADGLRM